MSESDKKHNLFPLKFQLDTGTKVFKSVDELVVWSTQEEGYFNWLDETGKLDPQTRYIQTSLSRWLNQLKAFRNNIKPDDSAKTEKAITTLKGQIETARSQDYLITSNSPIAKYARKIMEEHDVPVAAYTIGSLLKMKPPNPGSNKPIVESTNSHFGRYLAFQYLSGTKETVKTQIDSLNEVRTDWEGKFEEAYYEINQLSNAVKSIVDEANESFEVAHSAIDKKIADQEGVFSGLVASSEETLSDIAKTYDSKLALQSSIQYWTDKRSHHTDMLKYVGAATVSLAFVTGGCFVFAAYKLLNVQITDVELWRLGVMLAISTFGIWVTRLASKIFVSNLHLRTDSDERVTMIQTYLAMLREGSGPKEEERQLILETLFRPSATGYIKDDGPSSFHDVAKSVLSKG